MSLDIKGTILLGTSITFLLLALSFLAEDNKSFDSNDITLADADHVLVLVFLAASTISTIIFVRIEQKTISHLLDIKFIASWKVFPWLLVFLIMGFTMFMIYQTVPILVNDFSPVGFGGNSDIFSSSIAIYNCFFLIMSPLSANNIQV